MPAPLVKLPNSKDEFLVFVLENGKFKSLVSVLRWIYSRTSVNSQEVIERRMAVWIRNNWHWLVKDYQFVNDGDHLRIEFAIKHVVNGNAWSVPRTSRIMQEKELYYYVKSLDVSA